MRQYLLFVLLCVCVRFGIGSPCGIRILNFSEPKDMDNFKELYGNVPVIFKGVTEWSSVEVFLEMYGTTSVKV